MPMTKRADFAQSLTLGLAVVLAALFLRDVYYLWIGLHHPALDQYAFRQTQTALSAYWLAKDGFRFAYETPVLGAPWSIPYEFPLYEELVALASKLGPSIDASGRLVSFAFYIATLYPLWLLCRALDLPRLVWLIVAVLFLASPLYTYWARTIMVESCALFFSMLALALIAQYLKRDSLVTLVLAFAAGSLAVLSKSTTYPPYAFLAGLLIIAKGLPDWEDGELTREKLKPLLAASAVLIATMIVGSAWTWYSDAIKTANAFGGELTSTKLAHWNFGSWEQRASLAFWRDAILGRALPQIFGYCFALAGLAALGALFTPLYRAFMLAAVAGFILPFLLFTNLHFVHSYYQNANGLLGLIAVGLGVAAIADRGHAVVAMLLLAAIVTGQILFFRDSYVGVISADFAQSPLYRFTQDVKKRVPEDQGLLVLGQDWSSVIPYYTERKSLALPNWMPIELTKRALDAPETFLGGLKLGGVVYCTEYRYNDKTPLIEAATAGRAVLVENGSCKLLAATR